MPPKTVTCSICGQEVLKAQTLARPDKSRACRSHPGIESESQTLQEAAKAARAQDTKKKYPFGSKEVRTTPHQFSHRDPEEFRTHMYSHCWTCDCKGISLREHFFQCLIAMRKLRLNGKFNFLSLPGDMKKLIGSHNVLAIIPYNDSKDGRIKYDIFNRVTKELVPLLGFMNLCTKCIEKYGINDRLEALISNPTPEQLSSMVAVMPVIDVFLDEIIQKDNK